MKTQTNYRIDGAPSPHYAITKEYATEIYDSIIEDYGEAAIYEITEEWDETNKEWEWTGEDIIKSNMAIHELGD